MHLLKRWLVPWLPLWNFSPGQRGCCLALQGELAWLCVSAPWASCSPSRSSGWSEGAFKSNGLFSRSARLLLFSWSLFRIIDLVLTWRIIGVSLSYSVGLSNALWWYRKGKEQTAGNRAQGFSFFLFFLPQYVFAFRCLGKTMCGFGSFSHWSMFWPRWLSAPRSTTWDASRWVSATTKLFCGCFLFEPLQVTSVAFGRTVRPVLWPALVWGYPFLSLTWSISWALKSLLLLLPRHWESAGLICCLLCCAPEGWARWGEGREGLLGSLVHVLCLQMCFSFLFCSCLPQMALTQVTGSSSHSLKWLSSGGEAGGAWMCVEGGLVCHPGIGSWELKFVCQQFC